MKLNTYCKAIFIATIAYFGFFIIGNAQSLVSNIGIAFDQNQINSTKDNSLLKIVANKVNITKEKLNNSTSINGLLFKPKRSKKSNELQSDRIKFYPNPINSVLIIENINDLEFNVLDIFSISGQLVKTITRNSISGASINVENLNNGMYFLMTDTSLSSKLFIKE